MILVSISGRRDGEAELAEGATMSSVTCVSGWSLPSAPAAARQCEIGVDSLGQRGLEFEFRPRVVAASAASSRPWRR